MTVQSHVPVYFYMWQYAYAVNYTTLYRRIYTRWAKLNRANAVSFVVVKQVLENFDLI